MSNAYCLLPAAPSHQPSDHEQDDRAERRDGDRAQIEIARVDRPPAEARRDEAAQERADDAQDDREDAAGRVASRHEELRERPGDEPEEKPVEHAKMRAKEEWRGSKQ